MAIEQERDQKHPKGDIAMKTPPIVSPQEWEAARQQLLVKEKALTHARDGFLFIPFRGQKPIADSME